MPASLTEPAVVDALTAARVRHAVDVPLPEARVARIDEPRPSPVDWRDHWIYFVMIDRFNNPDRPPRQPWDLATGARQGGTFEGIRRQLDYITALGAGALWLTPVFRNPQSQESHHGYGIDHFLEVDPRFGTRPERAEAEFIRLVEEAHARGLYVILDIVLNHAGNVCAYDVDGRIQDAADWRDNPYAVLWRDEDGTPRWPEPPDAPPPKAALWPTELRSNLFLRRQGRGGPLLGDFESLKEFRTELTDAFGDKPVWNRLIQVYQYAIARFDIDGFRIDTLKHVEREFALTFCNAVREYAYAIGKSNFFIFGETKDDEAVLAEYTGRFTSDEQGRFGADASIDFPLMWALGPVAKGFAPPTRLEDVYALRKRIHEEKHILSTHGEASRFFVTCIDNHDEWNRFLYPREGGDLSRQLTLAVGCLFGLQGIPCLYYGTEQGLRGTQELYADRIQHKPEHVREALWGKPRAFDRSQAIFQAIAGFSDLRAGEPALRYGRQYFRPVSGNGSDFGSSSLPGGIIAFSRILNDREVVIAANTSVTQGFDGWVLVDARINADVHRFQVACSNQGASGTRTVESGPVTFHERDGSQAPGWARRVRVELRPMEIQFLRNRGTAQGQEPW